MRVCDRALRLFAEGQRVASAAGLILADTKYEFGLAADDGDLLLIDEVHTPDSSRYWMADSYAARLESGDEPESLDKEVVRRALIDLGYDGNGVPPVLPPDVVAATTDRYISAYERITGCSFERAATPAARRIERAIATLVATTSAATATTTISPTATAEDQA